MVHRVQALHYCQVHTEMVVARLRLTSEREMEDCFFCENDEDGANIATGITDVKDDISG